MRYEARRLLVDGIEITVTFKPIKSLRLLVKPTGSVLASVPVRTSRAEVLRFLKPRIGWVKAQLRRLDVLENRPAALASGERHQLWGRWYELEVVEGKPKVRVLGERIVLAMPTGATLAQRQKTMEKWYRERFLQEIEAIRPQLQRQVGREAAQVAVRWMKTRWGSCNVRTGRINLNLELVKRERRFLRATFTHELCHLIAPGHGQLFQAQMDRCCPEWRMLRKQSRSVQIGQSFWG
ncbi:MAG: M48 family metallopeptidase [Propionibacteriaceae bacterium]|jgi:predicted metal-dependent hydrolase|nr:M48 family metallopeptidase [Propionibacteriaceae bacterium]